MAVGCLTADVDVIAAAVVSSRGCERHVIILVCVCMVAGPLGVAGAVLDCVSSSAVRWAKVSVVVVEIASWKGSCEMNLLLKEVVCIAWLEVARGGGAARLVGVVPTKFAPKNLHDS